MRAPVVVVESRDTVLQISPEEAELLTALGRRLAIQSEWWGATDEGDIAERSLISCRRQSDDTWVVRIREAIGTLGVGDLRIQVVPKIPREHFLYIALHSRILPRVDEQTENIDLSGDLGDLVALWFLGATEKLLRGELSRGYSETEDELAGVQGALRPLETARLYYSGRAAVHCRFEDFSQDTALNRVVKAAAQVVVSSPCFSVQMRRRARGILARMEDVGAFVPSDFRVSVDRLTHRYKQSIAFAKYLISHSGVQLAHGAHLAWSFLIRTPELIEDGVRTILQDGLSPHWDVRKARRWIPGSKLTLNPDIVVNDGFLVGDVKYTLAEGGWSRPDLYQIVAFAVGFGSEAAALVYFDVRDVSAPGKLEIGRLPVSCLTWRAHSNVHPAAAASEMVKQFQAVLASSATPSQITSGA